MAEGSHQTYGGWEPRHCVVCGKRVLVKNGCWHHPNPKYGPPFEPYAHHHDCVEGLRYLPVERGGYAA